MASARLTTKAAVGSVQWIKDEREQLAQLVEQDVEEFSYSARNELEWLNEHMADIFSKNQMNVTDVFKTPGKLRGKTPRTAQNKDAQRAPLTDLFAPNPQSIMSPARSTPFFQKVSKIAVAILDDSEAVKPATSKQKTVSKTGRPVVDSGYHGLPEDETDDNVNSRSQSQESAPAAVRPLHKQLLNVDARPTEESFVSAQEVLSQRGSGPQPDVHEEDAPSHVTPVASKPHLDQEISIHEDAPEGDEEDGQETPTVKDHTDSASYTSSPEKPLLRKSSLNFAALPPRETLTGKRSMGVRNSQFQASQYSRDNDLDDDDLDHEDHEPEQPKVPTSSATQKTSTQLLHEKINALGQTRQPRPSKSIPAMYPQLSQPSQSKQAQTETDIDDDDSWIAPIVDRNSSEATSKAADAESQFRPVPPPKDEAKVIYGGHQKSVSTSRLASPTKPTTEPESVSQLVTSKSAPNGFGDQTTTPESSPKKPAEGPLSASKARFYSVLKSAKGMFATSAGASAQAKLEASSLQTGSKESLESGPDTSRIPGGFMDDAASMTTTTAALKRPLSAILSPSKEGRKTRSSTESDKRKKAKAEPEPLDDLERIREQERQKAAQQKLDRERVEEERKALMEKDRAEKAAVTDKETQDQPQELKSMPSAGKLRAPGRLTKPSRPAPGQASKPVPVNIRVASQAQRFGSVQPSTSTNSLLDNAHTPGNRPPSAAGRPGMARAGSSNPPSNARKALEAAARKKELEEKAAARKAEQKKELERKRAARLEEDRKAEQDRRAEEQRKVQEARAAAQKQAEQRKLEAQRREAAVAKTRADAELAEALEREKARNAVQPPRADMPGTIRQLTKATVVQDSSNKSVKRPLQGQNDEPARASTMHHGMQSYQQQDAKRRRTEDEDDDVRERHSVMAPPKRPSNMHRGTLMGNKFPHGYAHAPPPAAHHAQNNIYKASVASQPIISQLKNGGPSHPTETIKLSTARIPFAEPPATSTVTKTPTAGAGVFKTPARPAPSAFAQQSKARSSPAYPNGDNIALPEIHTDSEDEPSSDDDSDSERPSAANAAGGFRAPSWVASPALRDLLTQQQLVDPESVFGPIAALNMDDVFRGGDKKHQDRIRRYRDRGESALWTESGDAVTSAEKRKDREARERVARDGGWTFTRDI